MHRTHIGVDADPVNLLLGGISCAIADYTGCHIGTDLADILFGTPVPIQSEANMGVMKEKLGEYRRTRAQPGTLRCHSAHSEGNGG